jgi:hypothetical protein
MFEVYAFVVPHRAAIEKIEGSSELLKVLIGTFDTKKKAEDAAIEAHKCWLDQEKTVLAVENQIVAYHIEEVP